MLSNIFRASDMQYAIKLSQSHGVKIISSILQMRKVRLREDKSHILLNGKAGALPRRTPQLFSSTLLGSEAEFTNVPYAN